MRFDLPPDLWQGLDFMQIRALTNGFDLNRAAVEVERRRIHCDRYSPEWDLCDFYSAILMVYGGQGTAAREWLNAQFSSRVDEARYQSSGRLLVLQLLLCLSMGHHRDKRELLENYARRRLHGVLGTSRFILGLLLRALQSNKTLIALLSEEQASNKMDAVWRSFSLAAAYLDIGCIDEAVEHHENAWAMVEVTGAYLPAFMFREDSIRLDKLRECLAARRVSASPEYRTRLSA